MSKKSGLFSKSSPKSIGKILIKGQALTEEQKITKMVKKLEELQKREESWEKGTQLETDTFDDKIKQNISQVGLKMFKNKLPTEKSRVKMNASVKKTNSDASASSVSHDETVENAKCLVNAEDIKRIYLSEGWGDVKEARIKLIVTAISLHNPPGVFKDALVRAMGIAQLGIVHTAVQIGPIVLEWNDSSILVPCETLEWVSSKVLLALDMKTISVKDFFNKYANPVSEVIANWNGTYMYNEYTNNCQLFSEEILKAMEIENVFTGKVKKFLDSISTADTRELVFKHKFDDDPREYEIRNHSDLDELCYNKNPLVGSEDYRLLKAYDRVFWLRYHGVAVSENLAKDRDLQNQLLLKFKSGSTCFFGDPTQNSDTCYPKAPTLQEIQLQLAQNNLTF